MKSPYFEIYQEPFNNLIDPAVDIEIISSGHQFTEGPVWDKKNNRLLFSDIPANTIFSWNAEQGTDVFLHPSHFSNALALDEDGNLVICEHRGRAISLLDFNRSRTILVDSFSGFRLNSPNDLVIASDGSIIFTDPIYGLKAGNGGPAKQELPFQGVYRLRPGQNKPILITDSFERPNGLAFSPDETKLFVADTVKQHIRVFNIGQDWKISGGDIWTELWDEKQIGRPDGIKFDRDGNLFSTGPGGIWIFSKDAVLLGRIYLPDKTSNLTWGEDERNVLYITSSDKVYRLPSITTG